MSTTATALITALLDPAVYPHPTDTVELVETHISWVLLAGAYAYKVKKPVNLGFLDFTTLERRRACCEDEVRLNRRLTRDVYLGVVELKGTDPVRFDGPGPVREVAVAMRRLPHDRMLDQLVRRGTASPDLLVEIGRLVAAFHAEAATGGEIDRGGRLQTVRQNWDENFAQTSGFVPGLLSPSQREVLQGYVMGFLAREADRFAARVGEGHIRDCHGDLQAEHICCTEPIQIFDCIEFNERFRFGDTASEIAFLLMDLDRLGRPELGMRFLNTYLEESGDLGAVPLLDFYRSYRAFVRGKVLSFRVNAYPDVAPAAQALFELAVDYVKGRHDPRLVIMTGVMGSGKSTMGRELACRLGAILVRTDAIRKRMAGLPLTTRGHQAFGEGLYTPAMGERTYAETLRIAGEMLRAGWPVVLDGSFSSVAERRAARELAARCSVPHTTVWCDAPDAVLADRLRRRSADGREISDAREELLAHHRARYESPVGEPDVVEVDTAGAPAAAVDLAFQRLRSSGHRRAPGVRSARDRRDRTTER